MNREAIESVLNGIAQSLRVGPDNEIRAETDVGVLFGWVIQQGVPKAAAEALVERAARTGMPVDLGGFDGAFLRAVMEEAAEEGEEVEDGGRSKERQARDSAGNDARTANAAV